MSESLFFQITKHKNGMLPLLAMGVWIFFSKNNKHTKNYILFYSIFLNKEQFVDIYLKTEANEEVV